jgi:hypothetical protein
MYSVHLSKKPAALNFRVETKLYGIISQKTLILKKIKLSFTATSLFQAAVNVCNAGVSFYDIPPKDNFWKMYITVSC